VVPAHNEALGIVRAVGAMLQALASCGMWLEIIVVDDGSRDETFELVKDLSRKDARLKGLRLSRNFGKEAALLAGLRAASGDAMVTIDSDLQHPPALILEMIDAWRNGAMVVDAEKRGRKNDGAVARLASTLFHSFLSRLGGINLRNSSDFKLLDRSVVVAITRGLPERQRFYRGLAEWVGYPHASIPFDVGARVEGRRKWTLWKLMDLAVTATVAFTSAPLRIVTFLGLFTLVFGFAVGVEALTTWLQGRAVSGITTIIITILIVGSVIMISLGIIGEYIAKIYDEIKARPAYLVERAVGFGDEDVRRPDSVPRARSREFASRTLL